ncbi:MAG: branched-chain amino acid transport system II carrier protein, partial [Clostridia bacterium]|nr:branched-chain amino acid transport system II carrier protein [Clostridia bacterium]
MNYKSKRYIVDGALIGSALFSMLFGACHMIFPPYLGLKSGTEWVIAFISYFIADIGFALLAVFAIIKNDNNSSTLSPLGKYASLILTFAVFMCIGPLITIPRTAAT